MRNILRGITTDGCIEQSAAEKTAKLQSKIKEDISIKPEGLSCIITTKEREKFSDDYAELFQACIIQHSPRTASLAQRINSSRRNILIQCRICRHIEEIYQRVRKNTGKFMNFFNKIPTNNRLKTEFSCLTLLNTGIWQ